MQEPVSITCVMVSDSILLECNLYGVKDRQQDASAIWVALHYIGD